MIPDPVTAMYRSIRISAATLASLLPAAALAQASPDTARVAPVVVTATRAPIAADRAPASVTVVTGAELRARGLVHLTDAMRLVPGVAVAQAGSYGAPASVFIRGGQANYTKVLIDGVPANEPGGAFDWGTLTLEDVERIEIVRGPASVVWGSDAVAGVVHVITRRGLASGASAAARAGTFGSSDFTGTVEGGSATLRGSLTGGHHRSRGAYAFNSDYRNTLLGGSVTWMPAALGEIRIGGRYADLRAHFPTDFTGAPVDSNSWRDEERVTASAEWSRPLGAVTSRLVAGHTLVTGSSVNPMDGPVGASTTFDTRTRRQQLEWRLEAPLAAALTVSGGALVEWQRRTNASNTRSNFGGQEELARTSGAGARTNRGAYAELLGGVGRTTLAAGARLDDSEMYGSFATWRIALTHRLPTATRLRASVGTAFREPSFDEALETPFSTGNPDIRPERTASWEAGAEQSFAGERVVVGATYFDQRFTDMIDYFADVFPGRYENVARASASGTELEARVQPAAPLTIEASYARLWTRVRSAGFGSTLADGRTLLRRPDYTATASLAYVARRGSASVQLSHVGPRDDVRFLHDAPYSREETLPAYTRVDVAGELPLAARRGQPVALTLRIENLLGEAYEPVAGYAAPGRALHVGLRAGFRM